MLASECCSRYSALFGDLRRVDGDVNCAQQQGGEVGDRPLRTVLAQDGDAVAFANSPGLQLAGGGKYLGLQLGGGNWFPRARLAGQHHAVSVAVHNREEDFVEGPNIHGLRVQCERPSLETAGSLNQNVSFSPAHEAVICDIHGCVYTRRGLASGLWNSGSIRLLVTAALHPVKKNIYH